MNSISWALRFSHATTEVVPSYSSTRSEVMRQLDDRKGRLALERHDREAKDIGRKFVHQARYRFANPSLDQDEIGYGDTVMRIDVTRERNQRAVGHPHCARRHVLERVRHR
jgi:hypothetical protein